MNAAAVIVEAAKTPIQQMCIQLNEIFDAAFYSNDPVVKNQYNSDLNELYARSIHLEMPIIYDEYLGFVPLNMRGL